MQVVIDLHLMGVYYFFIYPTFNIL